MKILFAGTGSIAVDTLEALAKEGLVGAVLTAPDERGKRGSKLIPSPVKVKALELGLEVYQPETLRTEARKVVRGFGCDTLVSFCYGKIFGPMFLALFERKYNIHPSLLPKYRGCAPLYQTILNGDRTGGITLQEIALGVDEGDIISTCTFDLDGKEDQDTLERKVSPLAAELALSVFRDIDRYVPRKQEGEPCYSDFITKEDGILDFSMKSEELHARIRACYPWPKASTTYNGNVFYITGVAGSVFDDKEPCTEKPGTVTAIVRKKGFKVATGDGYLYISRVQAPSKKEMDAQSYFNGDRGIIGAVLGE